MLTMRSMQKQAVEERIQKQANLVKEQRQKNDGNSVELKIVYGNRHKLLAESKSKKFDNKHEWTMFVKFQDANIPASSLIAKVRYGLDPSFGVDHMEIKSTTDNEYVMKFNGFAIFGIPITIFFRRETQLKER